MKEINNIAYLTGKYKGNSFATSSNPVMVVYQPEGVGGYICGCLCCACNTTWKFTLVDKSNQSIVFSCYGKGCYPFCIPIACENDYYIEICSQQPCKVTIQKMENKTLKIYYK